MDNTNNAEKAKRAIEVYKNRGELALSLIYNKTIDELIATLKLRQAAYCNFLAYEQLAKLEGSSLDAINFKEIKNINNRLEIEIRKLTHSLARDLSVVKQERVVVTKFQSGQNNPKNTIGKVV